VEEKGEMDPDTKLQIDPELTRTVLKHFLRDEIRKVGFEKAVVGLSGGVDSAVACYLAAQAIGDFTVANQKALEEVIEKKGVKMIKAEPKGFKALTDKFDKVQRDSVIAAAKGFGVADPGKIIDTYKKNLAKWSALSKGVGTDIGKLTDLIWREIYAKVDPAKL